MRITHRLNKLNSHCNAQPDNIKAKSISPEYMQRDVVPDVTRSSRERESIGYNIMNPRLMCFDLLFLVIRNIEQGNGNEGELQEL
ncbi:hypothetical protein NliqN6_3426 [Naganishia liquefaciens]|uniref:Uncharacterized protein n=1 Tax=Naganishia liquefaciens TaxID=104408 RepID=A0A8H3YEZ0_9TREE|nr:hypothetical protein NliqN6_3426 [Naganishia liquefaciens]